MNRKHSCRVSRRYVCEDCSRKRVTAEGREFRLTDGQFRAAIVEADKQSKNESKRREEQRQERKQVIMTQREAHRNKYITAQAANSKEVVQESARDELFGGAAAAVANSMKNFFMDEVTVQDEESAEGALQGMATTLNQTRDAFNERGERLNTLSEKTSALKEASLDFAKMAKELEKQQKGGFFW